MNFEIIKPSEILAPFIKYYWVLKSNSSGNNNCMQRIVPNGFIELTFFFKNIPEYIRQKQIICSNNLLNGQQHSYYDVSISGENEMLSVVFQPYGTKLFVDLPSKEVLNQNVPGELVFDKSFKDVQSKMQTEQNTFGRIKVLEEFLLKQLTKKKEFEVKRIADSISAISAARGIISINSLSSRACLSEKQYKRTFEEFVGISPKRFLRIIRFQNCLYVKQTKRISTLTELSYECGYYDQAHMINDFKSLTGITPKQYFAECEPYSDYFSV